MSLLLRLWIRPAAAMSEILDRGSLLFASVAVLAITAILKIGAPWLAAGFFMPLLVLAVFYVPGLLVLAALIGRLGGLGIVFQRDYSPLLTCAAMALAAAEIPLAACSFLLPPVLTLYMLIPAALYFVLLMFFGVLAVFGVDNGVAAGVMALSWIPLVAAALAWGPLRAILGLLASPFFLFFAWYYLGSELAHLGDGLRARQNFRRMLEAATVNPHDGEAQYQLGLIHQQRRQRTEALQRFRVAVQIDPSLTDAHFQLGRIAREEGRLRDALGHFQTVVDQDERLHSSEVLKELGGIYVTAGQFNDAKAELDVYTERRPYDPEGLYYYGQTMEGLGDAAKARGYYARAMEADRTAPRYRRRFTAKWSRLAQKRLSKL
ncbi:MAG TPA: tetratricopeptide repeat protein [Verrucomicrobiae bacterium]|nr:tetratricopeptide repeat protein [Verrucomicrobiae bacterium]